MTERQTNGQMLKSLLISIVLLTLLSGCATCATNDWSNIIQQFNSSNLETLVSISFPIYGDYNGSYALRMFDSDNVTLCISEQTIIEDKGNTVFDFFNCTLKPNQTYSYKPVRGGD